MKKKRERFLEIQVFRSEDEGSARCVGGIGLRSVQK